MLRRVIQEQLKNVAQAAVPRIATIQTAVQQSTQTDDNVIPNFMLDFLGELES